MAHRLDALLRPRTVAVVGASARAESMGAWALTNLKKGGFAGEIFPVNPRYPELQGLRCYPGLGNLPRVPELVIFGLGDHRIEAAIDEAIALGVPAAVIMSTTVIDDDEPPYLKERLEQKIRAAGMLVCGSNGMGFYNVRDRVWACGFDSAMHEPPGNIALISHSGAGMSGIIDCDERVRINLAVSTGNELSVTMDEYLDFALDLEETRAVGLFIETARNPAGFEAALRKANDLGVPIVALKVGKTEHSARLAVSHSGAMAGDDAAYAALFERYGVQRVRDMDELATVLIMFAELHPVGPGGLVTLHDSGGERQLIIDLAAEQGVALTELGEDTAAALKAVIDPELPAVNPLDAWSRGASDYAEQMTQSLALMMQDEGAALGAAILNRAPEGGIYPIYLDYVAGARERAGKPVALIAARQGTGSDERVVKSTHAGIPVLDGVSAFLRGVRALFDYRDFLRRKPPESVLPDPDTLAQWDAVLAAGRRLDEADALQMLAAFDLPIARPQRVAAEAELAPAAAVCGYPLVLKTAENYAHKTEHGGVILGIDDEEELTAAYRDMAARLGCAAIVAPMAARGIEMMLGAVRDSQFGPIVVIGFGGIYAETLNDVVVAMPPFDRDFARGCVDRLRLRSLLDGTRGKPRLDIDAFCELAASFSGIIDALGEHIQEIDLNPVLVHAEGCTIVDALIRPVLPEPA